MIDQGKLDEIQQYRINRIRGWLNKTDCAGVILFDPVNIRYATGSRNMQVWTMHNLCRYALILESGKVVLFELPSSMHLSQNLIHIDEVRPAFSRILLSWVIAVGKSPLAWSLIYKPY